MITTINSYVQNKSTDYKALNSKLKNVELTPLELLNNVLKGFAVGIARLIENDDGFCHRQEDNFVSSQLVAIDIDNQKFIEVSGEKSKVRLGDNEGYLSYSEILNDEFIKNNASFVYTTPSHTDEWNRFRIFFVLKNPITDKEKHKKLIRILTSYYQADEAATSNTQVFLVQKMQKILFSEIFLIVRQFKTYLWIIIISLRKTKMKICLC